jgi:hypothetical protein
MIQLGADSDEARAFSPDEINRLWQHGLYEERLFHDRLNLFTILEMGLLTIFGVMYNKEPTLGFFLPLTIIALLFTLLWLIIQARHWSYCAHLTARSRRLVPEFKAAIDSFSEGSWARSYSVSRILALSIPALFGCIWVAFFIWMLVRPAQVVDSGPIVSLERLLLAIVFAILAWVVVKLRRLERRMREQSLPHS